MSIFLLWIKSKLWWKKTFEEQERQADVANIQRHLHIIRKRVMGFASSPLKKGKKSFLIVYFLQENQPNDFLYTL